MIDDLTAATSMLPADSGVWYPDDDHLIGYRLWFHAKHARTLNRADIARWMKSPVVR